MVSHCSLRSVCILHRPPRKTELGYVWVSTNATPRSSLAALNPALPLGMQCWYTISLGINTCRPFHSALKVWEPMWGLSKLLLICITSMHSRTGKSSYRMDSLWCAPASLGYPTSISMPQWCLESQDLCQFRSNVYDTQGISFFPFPKWKFTFVRIHRLLWDWR